MRTYRHLFLNQHISGIHTGIQLHNGRTGFLLPINDSPLNRSGSPIFRKEGPVYVNGPVCRNVQKRFRKDTSIGDDYQKIRLHLTDSFYLFLSLKCFRLIYRDILFHSQSLYRRRGNLLPPAIDTVRLCVYSNRGISVITEFFQGRYRKIGSPHKYDAQ